MPDSVLSVRADDGFSPMADDVRIERGRSIDLSAPRIVILIHGFQNSPAKAHRSFESFMAALRTTAWPSDTQRYGEFWEFHWPGDHPNTAASIATFPVRVPDAIRAGEKLAEFLDGLAATQEISLVAHSLGCRVALECLHKIRRLGQRYRGPTVVHTFLLAAAVPASLCEPTQRLDRAVGGRFQYVFHSTKDSALKPSKFGVGEYLYGEHGEAVGCRGEPEARWSESHRTKLQHGQYWSSYQVAEVIARIMGPPGNRSLPHAALPTAFPEEWSLMSHRLATSEPRRRTMCSSPNYTPRPSPPPTLQG
jgi:pimeloyl-ACP methyl ester carboxylesterase